MGYLAPITNYQYIQYAERDIRRGITPIRNIPINRINATMNTMDFHSSFLSKKQHELAPQKQQMPASPFIQEKEMINQIYGQVTGMGQNFDAYV